MPGLRRSLPEAPVPAGADEREEGIPSARRFECPAKWRAKATAVLHRGKTGPTQINFVLVK